MTNSTKPNFSKKIKELEGFSTSEDFFTNTQKQNDNNLLSDPYPIASVNSQAMQAAAQASEDDKWFNAEDESYDGQLAVDVYQDKKNIYIKAAIAGVDPQNIDIDLNNDMVTIKGKRSHGHEEIDEDDYYIKECYWGGFSRSIILPVDIQTDKVKANIEHGLLTIVLPKSKRPRHTKIQVQEVKK